MLIDLGVEECVDGGIRLVGGESETEGRAEVCQGGVWGTICNDNWSTEDTEVVCGQLLLLSSGMTLKTDGSVDSLSTFNRNVGIINIIYRSNQLGVIVEVNRKSVLWPPT